MDTHCAETSSTRRPIERREAPRVSVIVPVYDHAGRLPQCLDALSRQTLPPDEAEILVVDNGGDPEISAVSAAFPRARAVREPAQGSYAARNRGIAEARGDVLAFTDADCVPEPDWLEKGLEALALTAADFVAGNIDVTVADPARPTAVERYEKAVSFRQSEYVRRWNFGATASLFVRRRAFEIAGEFDPRLRSLGDREWGQRATAAGLRCAYAPLARVRHPARRTFRSLAERSARVTGGFFTLASSPGRSLNALIKDAPMGLPFGSDRVPEPVLERFVIWGVAGFVVSVRALELIRLAAGFPPRR